jgi:hypothetical protein
MVSPRISARSAFRIHLLLVLSLLQTGCLPDMRARQRALSSLPMELVQSWCYHVQQDACEGSWSQPQPREVIFAGAPGVCDVAFALPRAVHLETEQGPIYPLLRFASDPPALTTTVYASRNLIVLDGDCELDILLLP